MPMDELLCTVGCSGEPWHHLVSRSKHTQTSSSHSFLALPPSKFWKRFKGICPQQNAQQRSVGVGGSSRHASFKATRLCFLCSPHLATNDHSRFLILHYCVSSFEDWNESRGSEFSRSVNNNGTRESHKKSAYMQRRKVLEAHSAASLRATLCRSIQQVQSWEAKVWSIQCHYRTWDIAVLFSSLSSGVRGAYVALCLLLVNS